MKTWFAKVRSQLTTGRVVLGAMVGGLLIALVYSESKGGLDEKMLSPLVMGQAATSMFDGSGVESVQMTLSEGKHEMKGRLATAEWHYRWTVGKTAEGPVTDDTVMSALFRQRGIEVREMMERGAPGSLIRMGYHTAADGGGAAAWTLKGPKDGPWVVDLVVKELLRSNGE